MFHQHSHSYWVEFSATYDTRGWCLWEDASRKGHSTSQSPVASTQPARSVWRCSMVGRRTVTPLEGGALRNLKLSGCKSMEVAHFRELMEAFDLKADWGGCRKWHCCGFTAREPSGVVHSWGQIWCIWNKANMVRMGLSRLLAAYESHVSIGICSSGTNAFTNAGSKTCART